MNLFNTHKRLLYRLSGFLQAALVFVPAVHASTNQTISWAHYHFPPVYIESGEHRGQGIADKIIELLQKEMPSYQHQSYSSSFTRIMRSFGGKGVVCTGMNKTAAREQKVIFSQAAVMYPSHTLSYLKSRKQELESNNNVSLVAGLSLASLLNSESLDRFGVTLNRSYNPRINKLIEGHQEKVHTFEMSTSMSSIFKQLNFQRISFTIEYPIVTFYWQQKLGLQEEISSVPLQDSSAGFVAYIACSRNEAGATAIKEINEILKKHRPSPSHRGIVERWLPPEMIVPYRALYSEYFEP
jgi:uncharacterized protein (TIGR02285 family)